MKYFHKLFGFYIFLVFFIWSLPRIVPDEITKHFVTDKITFFSDFLNTQRIAGSSLLPSAVVFSVFIFFLLSCVLELPKIQGFVERKKYNILLLKINSYLIIALCLYFLMLTKEVNLLLFLLFLFLVFFLLPKVVTYIKENMQDKPQELISYSLKYIWVTSFVILLLLLVKEKIEPFFFVQDENHSQFLPRILVALRMIFSGEFPFLDNYHHFGAPLFEIGSYGFLNPLMVFSFVLAKYILGNIYTTLDIYSILSIFCGSLFLGYALKELKISGIVGVAAQISFSFLGFVLIFGRSWYYIVSVAFFLPALFYFFILFIRGKINFWWFFGSSIFRSFFFYSGNVQLFLCGVLIEIVSYIYFALKSHKRQLLYYYFCSALLTFGMVLPLLICQFISFSTVERRIEPFFAVGGISLDGLVTSFIPYPLTKASHPINYGENYLWRLSNLYHIGFMWVTVFFVSLFLYIKSHQDDFAPLLVLTIFLLVLSAGSVSLVYPLKYFIPFFNKTYFACKFYPFAAFLMIVYGTLKLNKFFVVFKDKKVFSWIVLINILVTILVGVFGTNKNAYWHLPEKPYPVLHSVLASNFSVDDFIWSVNPHRYSGVPYVTFLSNNYSALYDLMCINIYDPFLPTMIKGVWGTQSFDEEQFRKLGITKVIYQKVPRLQSRQRWEQQLNKYRKLHEDKDFALFDTGYPPWIIKQVDGLPGTLIGIIEYTRNKIKAKIYSGGSSKWLYHNEYRNGYELFLNGRRSKIFSGFEGWCVFELPSSGLFDVEIKYVPQGFRTSVFLGMVLVLVSILAYSFCRRRLGK